MDREDFLKHFMDCERSLRAYLLGVTGSCHDTEDILQNVWGILWRKLDDYDASRPFAAWAFGVARLEALKWRQRQARSREILSEAAVAALAETAAEQAEEISARHVFLLACIEELKGTQRRVLEMKYQHGMKIREVAEALRIRVAAVEMMLVRVRRGLRDCIDKKMAHAGS